MANAGSSLSGPVTPISRQFDAMVIGRRHMIALHRNDAVAAFPIAARSAENAGALAAGSARSESAAVTDGECHEQGVRKISRTARLAAGGGRLLHLHLLSPVQVHRSPRKRLAVHHL